jgi:hypothetical protein
MSWWVYLAQKMRWPKGVIASLRWFGRGSMTITIAEGGYAWFMVYTCAAFCGLGVYYFAELNPEEDAE